jgi:hypothetical protein
MTNHDDSPCGTRGGCFVRRAGLYRTLAGGPLTARELAVRSGLPEAQISHWLAGQESGGYVVRDFATGSYQTWCDVRRNSYVAGGPGPGRLWAKLTYFRAMGHAVAGGGVTGTLFDSRSPAALAA